jgi:hypothetical protein
MHPMMRGGEMPSAMIIVTSISSFLGFLLNTGIMILILLRCRKLYHYLFAGILFICAVWDFGIFLTMIRNTHVNELPIFGYVISIPCTLLMVLFYHFTGAYLNQVKKRTTIVLWAVSIISFLLLITGLMGKISGVYNYSWGNLFRPDEMMLRSFLLSFPLYYFSIGASVYFLSQAYRKEKSRIPRRHLRYIMISFIAVGLALIKILALYNIDNPVLLPFGMAMNDIFIAVIGIAIVKDKLFDITVIVKMGTIYSILGALVIFLFSFIEHLLTTYFSELVSGHSTVMHLLSVAIAIAVLMPVKHRLEKGVGRYFANKQLQF